MEVLAGRVGTRRDERVVCLGRPPCLWRRRDGEGCGAWIDGELVVAGSGGGDGVIGDLGLLIGCPRTLYQSVPLAYTACVCSFGIPPFL